MTGGTCDTLCVVPAMAMAASILLHNGFELVILGSSQASAVLCHQGPPASKLECAVAIQLLAALDRLMMPAPWSVCALRQSKLLPLGC
jgi:hypothetical protein